ncbi:MAG: hypothetical protein JO040_14805 [Gemmatimonadetes bacterium]|nr:hypothetical protein [Gemmatimonadota bacterium]
MKRILLLAALLLALPPSLGAQDPGRAAQRIEAARRQASGAGVPVALLDSKVAEGEAKGVPADRIAAAVEARLALLIRARGAMAGAGRTVSAADLSVGADALAAGVSGEALASLTQAAPADRRAVAIAVLTQLVQQGEAADRALQRVRLALANPESLRSLPGQANNALNPAGPKLAQNNNTPASERPAAASPKVGSADNGHKHRPGKP